MPLDNSMDDSWKRHCIGWEFVFSVVPRRCHLSNKLIWMRRGYRGIAMWTGPGEPAFDIRWVDRNEYLLAKIKGII
jgi:hypothetical protein